MHNLLSQLKSFDRQFWLLNFIQMLERLAYSALVLQMAVYISQKDIPGGLHWEHTQKGLIFFVWALVQNLIPVITGGLADKYGRKNVIITSLIIAASGFFFFAFQREFWGVMFAAILVGVGLGSFKPALHGMLSNSMKDSYTAVGWGMNIMLINVAFFFAPALSKYLEDISWQVFFISTGSILLIIIPLIYFINNELSSPGDNDKISIKEILVGVIRPKIISFVVIMGGFTMIYMQFYETLPNFIYDWVDTSNLALSLNLPEYMLMETSLGKMIDFKWLYTLNSGFIVAGVVTLSWLMAKIKLRYAILMGIFTASLGLFVSGASSIGSITVIGMLLYTLGEMITNPRYLEYMASLGSITRRSAYMGYLNISFAIGLAGGSLVGGYLYQNVSEKSMLAMRYIIEHKLPITDLKHSNAIGKLSEYIGVSIPEATELLWSTYNPNSIWYIFLAIGMLSCILVYIHSRYFKDR